MGTTEWYQSPVPNLEPQGLLQTSNLTRNKIFQKKKGKQKLRVEFKNETNLDLVLYPARRALQNGAQIAQLKHYKKDGQYEH